MSLTLMQMGWLFGFGLFWVLVNHYAPVAGQRKAKDDD
jgi:hypothetical protein